MAVRYETKEGFVRCTVRYGVAGLSAELPDTWDVTPVVRPAMPGVPDPTSNVESALDSPIGAGLLGDEVRGRRRACLMVCDATRPVPNRLILRPVVQRLLAAGCRKAGITILVATGLHRPSTPGELDVVIGDPWVADHAVIACHAARDASAHVLLGTTSQGVPVRIDRRVVEADIRIAIGLVEPHFMAGWSGGRKLVLPGCASAETIQAFHSARMLGHPRAGTCLLDGNPLHQAQEEALAMLGRTLAVSVVINDDRSLAFASFGEAGQSLAAAVRFAEPYVKAPLPAYFPVVLTTAGGMPLDATWYQAVKGACGAVPILQPGGDLFVAAGCSEGLGSADFRASQQQLRRLGVASFRAEALRRECAEIDEWQTVMLLRALEAGAVHLYSEGLTRDDHALTGARPVTNLVAEIAAAMERAGSRRLAVIPEGPYVAPFIRPPSTALPAGSTRADGRAPGSAAGGPPP